MPTTSAQELYKFGQSIWLDNISRSMIESRRLEGMIDLGISGMTSNPSIFEKAISASADYDELVAELCSRGKSTFEIYDGLTSRDVCDAADIFLDVFTRTRGLDGFVSLEINPKLAHDAAGTVREGLRLFKELNRPNVMLKIPATTAGFNAIEELTSRGININVTLIFSLDHYINAASSYLRGIRRFVEDRGDVTKVRSVASVFVSRIDTRVDNLLEESGMPKLKGSAAASNCALIYKKFLEIFSSPEFEGLKEKGVNAQRVLWASTSTKNPAYSDIKYVRELIAKDTVNTMPDETFKAFLNHGKVKEALTHDASWAESHITALSEAGIDIDEVCTLLQQEGIAAFEKSFDSLLSGLEKKRNLACKK
jgi:transaldolase